MSTYTCQNRTEQRKQWNKQYGSEICYTESLYSFVYSNHVEIIRCIKRENAWIKCKVQNIYI